MRSRCGRPRTRPLFTRLDGAGSRGRACARDVDQLGQRAAKGQRAAAALHQTWRAVADRRALDDKTPEAERQALVEAGLQKAIAKLTADQGADWQAWRWGRMHTRAFAHPVSNEFDLPTVERHGGAGAVAADGASYREIMDVSDWDRSLAVNVPGQSGQPESPFYGSLLSVWAENQLLSARLQPESRGRQSRAPAGLQTGAQNVGSVDRPARGFPHDETRTIRVFIGRSVTSLECK